jgi:hypothetical protein
LRGSPFDLSVPLSERLAEIQAEDLKIQALSNGSEKIRRTSEILQQMHAVVQDSYRILDIAYAHR